MYRQKLNGVEEAIGSIPKRSRKILHSFGEAAMKRALSTPPPNRITIALKEVNEIEADLEALRLWLVGMRLDPNIKLPLKYTSEFRIKMEELDQILITLKNVIFRLSD